MTFRTKDTTHATQCNNTEICYTYCDASNYKVHNTVVVAGNLTPAEIEQILSTRHEGEFFIPSQVGLPENRFSGYGVQDDHIWFILPDDAFSPTNRKNTTHITAAELLSNFKKVNGNWNELVAWARLAGECTFGAEDENWYGDGSNCDTVQQNEPHYIDVEDAIRALKQDGVIDLKDERISTLLRSIPAAKVAPMRTGHWIKDGDCIICSECGEEHTWEDYRASFCDVCGADMCEPEEIRSEQEDEDGES